MRPILTHRQSLREIVVSRAGQPVQDPETIASCVV
jgi:hypothetical protein